MLAGAAVNSYAYDAYGRHLAATEGVEISYGHTGRAFAPECDLFYFCARMYDTVFSAIVHSCDSEAQWI